MSSNAVNAAFTPVGAGDLVAGAGEDGGVGEPAGTDALDTGALDTGALVVGVGTLLEPPALLPVGAPESLLLQPPSATHATIALAENTRLVELGMGSL